MKANKRLLHIFLQQKRYLIALICLAFIFVISSLAQPFLLGKAIDASKNNNETLYLTLLFIALGLILVGLVTGYIFEVVVSNLAQDVSKNLRDEIYKKMNSISLKDFDQRRFGDMLQLEIRDMENIITAIFSIFKTLLQGIFTVAITIIMMFIINWILGLIVLVLSPLSILMSRFVSRFNHKHFKKQASLQASLNSLSLESINNMDLINAYSFENKEDTKFHEINEKMKKEGTIALFSASWINPSTRLVNNTIYAIVGVVGIIMLSGNLHLFGAFVVVSIGVLSSFLTYTTQYSKPFNEISSVVAEFEVGKSSFLRINDFLNLEDDIDEGKTIIDAIESIRFEHVYFSYNPDKPLIEDFSLTINKGDKVAIVGPTGAGKTTLINLLMRFYEINKGHIYINDIDIRDISKKSLRSQMGMVLQETWIFKGSVFDNVSYFVKDATLDDVKKACISSKSDEFISRLPNGYNTQVTSTSGLSMGEKQMIAISRVMMINPSLMILDEATSNIDTRNEKLIGEAFDKMMENKTSIIIAHRLSTIKKADFILMLKNGSIREIGSHKELMQNKKDYYEMYMSQYK